MFDVIDEVLGISPQSPLARIRANRAQAKANAQASYDALFDPVDDSHFSLLERHLVALFVAISSGNNVLADLYDAETETDAQLATVVLAAATRAATAGPFGHYREAELVPESTEGSRYRVPPEVATQLGARLTAALEHAHLLTFRPREASARALESLFDAGWSPDGVVSLSQLVAFLHFQHRVVWGLSVIQGGEDGELNVAAASDHSADVPVHVGTAAAGAGRESANRAASAIDVQVRRYPNLKQPQAFTRESLGWVPWIDPLPKEEFTERHWEGLVDKGRADFPYFALLARDPEILKARTLTDLDVFFNEAGGLPRAERELAATAVSRVNGCVFCASVHARAAVSLSGRSDEIDLLLADGIGAVADPRWAAIALAAADLTLTPIQFDATSVQALREAGLADDELYDLVHAAAFFNWANRLMLSLGEPTVGKAGPTI